MSLYQVKNTNCTLNFYYYSIVTTMKETIFFLIHLIRIFRNPKMLNLGFVCTGGSM